MSSALLYLAIVVVWGIVLVPMWLRRDGSRTRNRRLDEDTDAPVEGVEAAEGVEEGLIEDDVAPVATPARAARHAATRRASRAAVIARRRRRTVGLILLQLTAVAVVVAGVTPWWFTVPPAVLLVGHLTLLRSAVRMDAERRARHLARMRAIEADRRARAEEEARLAREAAQRSAEIISMPERPEEQVYDQYTDQRAVGD
ncbi:divisome protein SepX/GlpR [Actinoallomurus rhizosphaericola]|uniref:divisome protein SepX/GlpR n=1 Tax=Actinoallomurus rhizosphaericola TaxID=2952536 RepID=UPI0020908CA4|nr:hypothetical protein [Actinoallomurus rhizosphaericola]MCO5992868.1 hypothetical protein [Actinoallomurus rhizosphaericola]